MLVLTLLAALPIGSIAPAWIWAALLMAGFAGLTVLTMTLARLPTRRAPPPVIGTAETPDGPAEAETLPANDIAQEDNEA